MDRQIDLRSLTYDIYASSGQRAFKFLKGDAAWQLVDRVRERFGLEIRQRASGGVNSQSQKALHAVLEMVLQAEKLTLPRGDRQALLALVEAEVLGYGPFDALLADPEISEIMVNGPNRVYIERLGRLEETPIAFRDSSHLMRIVERILSPLGRRVDETSPMIDARLPDGSRVNVIVPPLSLVGPVVTIRKFERDPFTMDDLISFGTLTTRVAAVLAACVRGRLNIIVSGGTGSGKTTTLNVLSSYVPEGERVVTIENAAELQLRQRHVVALESRPPNIEGVGEVTIQDLVINSLRMRPDRIVVGEVRGGEALDMLQAMNTGHEGSMTTLHANDAEEALLRIQTMVLLAGTELPTWAIVEQIGEAIQLLVHMERGSDGVRRIMEVMEIHGRREERVSTQMLFARADENAELEPTGQVPFFMERLKERGILLHEALFDPGWVPDDPRRVDFIAHWLQSAQDEPSPPTLTGRLNWADRYRLSDQAKAWLLEQVGPGTMLSPGAKASEMVSESIDVALAQEGMSLSRSERKSLQDLIEAEVLGYGPLDPLLADPEISEIMVNGPNRVYVERLGRLEETPIAFRDSSHLMRIVERILSPLGRRVDESTPTVDARLPDGSRVNVIVPPLSLVGPVVTIRKFERDPFTTEDLIRFGTLTPEVADFLATCIRGRLNLIVSGGTATGKTTMLNVLSSFIPEDERIVTIENAAELQLRQRHVVSLESRPPNIEGKGEIHIRDLMINALRMRPDRVIVGEVRGAEALDMLQAMSTGASLTTLHANDPREALLRLETMVMMAGFDLPIRAIREQIALSIDLFVQLRRMPDGSRRVVRVAEVTGLEGRNIILQDIFRFVADEVQGDEILGRLRPTGVIPKSVAKLQARGVRLDERLFMAPVGV